MRIVMLNGSQRKNGGTGSILKAMKEKLESLGAQVHFVHVSDLELTFCTGCSICFKKGQCIFHDDAEKLSKIIEEADGIVIGSPTYAGNVSGQIKVIIDRGHFVLEQLLQGKYALSVVTFENYGGRDASKVLTRLFSYSGAQISGSLVAKFPNNSSPLEVKKLAEKTDKLSDTLYSDIKSKRSYFFQKLKHKVIFGFGRKPFVLRKGDEYQGIVNKWNQSPVKE